MTDIYLGEFGKRVLVDLQYDISSATNVRILFSASAGTFSATCSIVGVNTTVSACGTIFSAEKAVEYIVASGDFSATGADTYTAWVESTFGTSAKLISSNFRFKVSNPGD
jgi:hypothetical protein